MISSSLTERLLPATERALLHSVAAAQAEGRSPSLSAAVARGGRVVWSGIRSADGGTGPGPDQQYRIGSITKTFTAVLVMRLRDEGLLDLGDPLEKHLPGTDLGEATIAQLLSHTAGLAAETPGLWWERTPAALRPGLAEVLGDAPFKHPVGRRFHYSNPGYTVLGSLVGAVRGAGWADAVREEILEPLGLERTSVRPRAPYAEGWAVHPFADVLLPEPVEDLGVMAPAGQMWSTAGDLCRFAGFLAEGDDRVLSTASVQEMAAPAAPLESGEWDGTYGLGVQVARMYGRTMVGHTGSLPGYVAGLWVSPADGVAAATLANATSGPQPWAVAAELVRTVAEAEPRLPEPWRPLPDADPELLALTGPWYWGAKPHELRLLPERGLLLTPVGGYGRGARFRAAEDGTWTGLDGYYAGETLRVVRRADGSVRHLDLGSFVLTREPYEPGAGVPGGVDPGGWRGTP
ncbi:MULTISPECIES: serine hydrolase domain-containing protein [Streptomyces]|uniref:serine hydrolase domain-containing protein n=1 Tax=Streptomyces TaxID=1883 RepID=UPI00025CD74B|nr:MULTISPECIES: serine hydrolase domain-containing protein [Streptomyces]EIF91041.1 beta-lactamase [Streptomyces tsukubensis NRRL18488]